MARLFQSSFYLSADCQDEVGEDHQPLPRSLSPDVLHDDTKVDRKRPSLDETRAEEKKKIDGQSSETSLHSHKEDHSRISMDRSVRSSVSSDRFSGRSSRSRSRSVLRDMGGTQLMKLTGRGSVDQSAGRLAG